MLAGILLILSGLAHSLLGGKDIGAQLTAANVSADLAGGLLIGWHFGGAAMLTFGAIVIWLFYQRRRGKAISLLPSMVIGIAYVAFGAYALVASSFNPFFSVFIVPGVLLVIASR